MRHLTISGFLLLLAFPAAQTGSAAELRPVSKGPTTLVNYMEELFFLTKSSGSLILKGTCKATNTDNDVVSEALPHPPQGPFQNLDNALIAVSQLNSHLLWSRDVDGLVRVRDNRVSNDVLSIRLQRVHFSRAVDSNAAIRSVLSTPEVQAYFKQNHIEEAMPFIGLRPIPSKGQPKLSDDLHNVTVAEAFDRIVRFFRFPRLWIYSECENGSLRRVLVAGF
jgi:hypothetical protein